MVKLRADFPHESAWESMQVGWSLDDLTTQGHPVWDSPTRT